MIGGAGGLRKIMTMDSSKIESHSGSKMFDMLRLKVKASGVDYGFTRSGSKLVPLTNPINTYNILDRAGALDAD